MQRGKDRGEKFARSFPHCRSLGGQVGRAQAEAWSCLPRAWQGTESMAVPPPAPGALAGSWVRSRAGRTQTAPTTALQGLEPHGNAKLLLKRSRGGNSDLLT